MTDIHETMKKMQPQDHSQGVSDTLLIALQGAYIKAVFPTPDKVINDIDMPELALVSTHAVTRFLCGILSANASNMGKEISGAIAAATIDTLLEHINSEGVMPPGFKMVMTTLNPEGKDVKL